MLTYGRQLVDEDDIQAVVSVLKGDWITQGPVIEKFETELSKKTGARCVSVVSSGTAALHLTGISLGWRAGDIILTSPISFLATANCIVYSGATPDFVDIDPITHHIDPNRLEEKIKRLQSAGKTVKGAIIVDYAGHPADWVDFRYIADRYGLQLVNDHCHAFGAEYKGDPHYVARYADVAILSFHPVKHITSGEGGAVVTNHEELNEKVRQLRAHGVIRNEKDVGNNNEPWKYEMVDLGFNYRITDIQSALGLSQLNKLDKFIKRRREIAKYYNHYLGACNNLVCPTERDWATHAYHLYPIQLDFDQIGISRTALFKGMEASGVRLQVHYIPIHLQSYYQNNYGFKFGDYPISESFYQKTISLPMYVGLNKNDLHHVINALDDYCNVGICVD